MFLVIFGSLYSGQHLQSRGGIPYNDFFVPGILAYGIIATTYVNMAISTAVLRDEGVLKKLFPIRALADGLQYAFDPRTTGVGLKGEDTRTLLIWTAVGIVLMIRFLRRPQGEIA